MNKKLLIVSIFLLFSKEVFSETYSCSDTLGPFALKRANATDFEYHREGMIHLYYRINIETEEYIFLSRDDLKFGAMSFMIIGKIDGSYVGTYLKHEDSSEIFNGRCLKIFEFPE